MLKYLDEDGDLVTLTDNADLAVAKAAARTLKITVLREPASPPLARGRCCRLRRFCIAAPGGPSTDEGASSVAELRGELSRVRHHAAVCHGRASHARPAPR